jgi:hypothetical protein
MVQKGHLYYFSPYCWGLGCVTLFTSFFLK